MSTRLAGKTVLVTRPRSQADELRALLEAHGARVVIQPVIEILPPKDPANLDAALRERVDESVGVEPLWGDRDRQTVLG